jgi:hypothetical protein
VAQYEEKRITKSTSREQLEQEAGNRELKAMMLECRDLARLYELPIIKIIPDGILNIREDDLKDSWIDNRDGTFTAKAGATLWGLYGSEWKKKSGYTGDPTKLKIGTVVGRKIPEIGDMYSRMHGPSLLGE